MFSTAEEADISTGSSYIFGPSARVDPIIEHILTFTTEWAADDDWSYLYYCSDVTDGLLPTIEFDYGGYWFEVTPENYSIALSDTVCTPAFGSYDIEYWVLGYAFLRDWYVIHDYENSRYGFTRLPGSSMPTPEPVPEVEDEDEDYGEEETEDGPTLVGILYVGFGLGFSFSVFIYIFLNGPGPSKTSVTPNKESSQE